MTSFQGLHVEQFLTQGNRAFQILTHKNKFRVRPREQEKTLQMNHTALTASNSEGKYIPSKSDFRLAPGKFHIVIFPESFKTKALFLPECMLGSVGEHGSVFLT